MGIEGIRKLQERAREIRSQIEPVKVIQMLSLGTLPDSIPRQIILRRKFKILTRLIRKATLQEIDSRGWSVRGGEIYLKKWPNHWCGTLTITHTESVRTETRAIMKEIPEITLEEALLETFSRRDREYELYGDVPTFLRREARDE